MEFSSEKVETKQKEDDEQCAFEIKIEMFAVNVCVLIKEPKKSYQ